MVNYFFRVWILMSSHMDFSLLDPFLRMRRKTGRIRPEPFVARVLPRLAVEKRIPPRAAERRKRGFDGGLDRPLAHRVARADALARARAPANKPVLRAPGLFSFPLAFLL